jgi:predicted nuclease of predicted toxin-antitoxin system
VLRFHLDENVDQALAQALSRRGLDVTLPSSVGLSGASDEEQIAFALRERRVIVTHDADFLRLAFQGVPHAGIAFCHFGTRTIGEMLRVLLLLSEFYEPEAILGRVEYL